MNAKPLAATLLAALLLSGPAWAGDDTPGGGDRNFPPSLTAPVDDLRTGNGDHDDGDNDQDRADRGKPAIIFTPAVCPPSLLGMFTYCPSTPPVR
jgi:hypothetical protein